MKRKKLEEFRKEEEMEEEFFIVRFIVGGSSFFSIRVMFLVLRFVVNVFCGVCKNWIVKLLVLL